jgi:O-antigen/teichoic acid export membrane protein
MRNLKELTVLSGFAKLCGEAVGFVLRTAGLVIMARLLDPADFGLVAMVTVVTGLYGIFTTAGLSAATIQKQTVTNNQISTLFWINILVGTGLGLLCLLTAPVLVRFYGEPRLFWITVIIAIGFIVTAAGVQHAAILERELRYVTLTAIERSSQLVSVIISIAMAAAGLGYWSLVVAGAAGQAVQTLSVWSITRWLPRLPRRGTGIKSMLHFGGAVTLNGLIVYVAYNVEKVLLGRFWGADILGLYGRAYQLVNIPTDNLNHAVGGVAFSALSRLQDDPVRLRRYFLKAYAFVNSLTVPTTMFCTVFADDIILLALGPKWIDAVPIFRLLAPTILIFGVINPLAWLLYSVGLQGRSLKIALVIAPLVIIAYAIGLPFGANGVAFAYSAAMMGWVLPHILWCLHGTAVSPQDLFWAILRPLLSAVVAAAVAFGAHFYIVGWLPPLPRLVMDAGVMIAVYYTILLCVMGQSGFYVDVIMELRSSWRRDMKDLTESSVLS